MSHRLATSVIACVSAIAVLAGVGAPAALAAPAAVKRVVTVKEGVPAAVTGQVPTAYANSLVVLETVKGRQRQELGETVSGRHGEVRLPVVLAGAGTYAAQWRVVRNSKTRWTSPTFTLKITPNGRKKPIAMSSEAATIATHSGNARSGRSQGRSGMNGRMLQRGVTGDISSAISVAQEGVQLVGAYQSAAQQGTGWQAVGDGFKGVFDSVFFPPAAATGAEVQALSNQVAQGFSMVQSQLDAIQADLETLQEQMQQGLAMVDANTVQANASSAAGTCATLMSEANGYVDQIQDVVSEYQTVLDLQWMQANIIGQSPQTALTTLGNKLYGAGAGIPTFSSGVSNLQATVSELESLLSTDGGVSEGLGVCGSAVAANIAATYATQQQAAGLTQGQAVVPIGAVDAAYFSTMQQILAYYATWMTIGQDLAARGGQMGLAVLEGDDVTSTDDLQQLCVGIQPMAGASTLSCGGIAYHNAQAITTFNNAFASVGASWSDVTGGLLASDAKAGIGATGIVAPANLWVQDIATYGSVSPYAPMMPGATFAAPIEVRGNNTAPGTAGLLSASVSIPATSQEPMVTFALGYPQGGSPGWSTPTTGTVSTVNGSAQSWSVTLPVSLTLPWSTVVQGLQIEFAGELTTTVTVPAWAQSSPFNAAPAPAALSSLGSPSGAATSDSEGLNMASWLGMSFQPASGAIWQSLIPTGLRQPSTSTSMNVGALMGQAGLLNGGQQPTDLILWTGDTVEFSAMTDGMNWFDLGLYISYDTPSNQDWTNSTSEIPMPGDFVSAFLDTNVSVNPGTAITVGVGTNPLGLGNIMNGGQISAVPITSCSSEGDVCGPSDYTNDLSMTMGSTTTQSSSFYTDVTLEYWYTVQLQSGYRATFSNIGSSLESMLGDTLEYGWPVSPLSATGQPSGSSCAMTQFSEGVDGDAGVANVCQSMFNDWAAGTVGVNSGPVSIMGGNVQGTLTAAGNNAITYQLTNTSGSAQTIAFNVEGSGGAQVGTTASVVPGSTGLTGLSCTQTNSTTLECFATVSPGTSYAQVPLTSSGGTVTAALAGGASPSASASVTTVEPVAAGLSELPTAVSNLAATAASAGNYVTASWTVPTVTPQVGGYEIVLTSPTGSATTLSTAGSNAITVNNGTTSGGTATTTLALPPGQPGLWTVGVIAVSPAGSGPLATVTATLGDSAPAAPTGFQANVRPDGTISLSWNPVTSNPALSNYALSITAPASGSSPGQTTTVATSVPEYVMQNLSAVGTYTFSLTAVNSLGASAPVTATANATGMVPTQPAGVDVGIDADGWVSAVWTSSSSIPAADSYYLALYAPGSTASSTPVASVQIAAPVKTSTVRVPDFYQLAKTSPAGEWYVAVTPTNSVGVGEYGMAQIYVTPGLLQRLTKTQADTALVASIPAKVLSGAKAACAAGSWSPGLGVFGTCANGTFTAAAKAA